MSIIFDIYSAFRIFTYIWLHVIEENVHRDSIQEQKTSTEISLEQYLQERKSSIH